MAGTRVRVESVIALRLMAGAGAGQGDGEGEGDGEGGSGSSVPRWAVSRETIRDGEPREVERVVDFARDLYGIARDVAERLAESERKRLLHTDANGVRRCLFDGRELPGD